MTTFAILAISTSLAFAGCGSKSRNETSSETSDPGILNIRPRREAAVTVTVHFRRSSEKADMAQFAEQLSDAVSTNLPVLDTPDLSALYEDYTIVLRWDSPEAGQRGEDRVRRFAADSPLVERIEVVRHHP